jgi:hypothetical protein
LSKKFKFTAEAVEALPFADAITRKCVFHDTEQPGLQLTVGRLTKTYYFWKRIEFGHGGARRAKIMLGRSDEIAPEEARRRSRTLQSKSKTAPFAKPDAQVHISDELLTTAEAAALTKMSISWLEHARCGRGIGPPFRRRGRAIRYLRSELLTWWDAGVAQ